MKVVAEIVRRAWWLRAADFAKSDYVRRDMVYYAASVTYKERPWTK